MKKVLIIGTLAALALIVFGVVGFAYAQSKDPGSPNAGTGYGCGMFGTGGRPKSGLTGGRPMSGLTGGRGMMGNRAANQGEAGCPMLDGDEDGATEDVAAEYGPLHDYMFNAFAQALGITPEELETRRQAGDTLWVIAQEKGLTAEQFQEVMTTARTNAANQAVADGVITQEQADFMLQRMGRMMGNGAGPGFGAGNGGCPHNRGGQQNNQP
jgi:hypothetical protein